MARKLKDLYELTDEAVEAAYDKVAESTSEGLAYWRDELERRSRAKLIESNQRLSRWSLGMAIVSGVASVAAVVLSIVTLVATAH